jgi:hypothetical protein
MTVSRRIRAAKPPTPDALSPRARRELEALVPGAAHATAHTDDADSRAPLFSWARGPGRWRLVGGVAVAVVALGAVVAAVAVGAADRGPSAAGSASPDPSPADSAGPSVTSPDPSISAAPPEASGVVFIPVGDGVTAPKWWGVRVATLTFDHPHPQEDAITSWTWVPLTFPAGPGGEFPDPQAEGPAEGGVQLDPADYPDLPFPVRLRPFDVDTADPCDAKAVAPGDMYDFMSIAANETDFPASCLAQDIADDGETYAVRVPHSPTEGTGVVVDGYVSGWLFGGNESHGGSDAGSVWVVGMLGNDTEAIRQALTRERPAGDEGGAGTVVDQWGWPWGDGLEETYGSLAPSFAGLCEMMIPLPEEIAYCRPGTPYAYTQANPLP